MGKWLNVLLIVGAMLWCLPQGAAAHDAVDLTHNCVISMTMHCGETVVGGGTVCLYRVGEIRQNNGDYSFAPTGSFSQCGLDFDDIESPQLPKKLYEYAKKNHITTPAYAVSDQGYIAFSVEPGLYLMTQKTPPKGYCAMNPFLVSVPMYQEGKYVYSVNASPKMELVTETPPPSEKPPRPSLPQTGQLKWPVPVLSISGTALLVCGWALCRKGRNEDA